MPQFSLKRLFASVTLIAVGCAMAAWSYHAEPPDVPGPVRINGLAVIVGILSIPFFGVGFGILLKQPFSGVIVGASVVLAMGLLFAWYMMLVR